MSKARVMIVDDELDFARTLASRLQIRGYEAHVVESFDKTIEIAQELKPEVVLLDLRLPGISGVEILMTIRQFCPGTEVILLTGHLNLEQTIEGVRLDSFHFIMKPFDIAELVQKIDALRRTNV